MRGGGVGWEGRRIHRKGQSYFKTSNFLCDCSFFLLNYEEYYFTTFISGNVRNTFNFSLFSQIAFFCEIKKKTRNLDAIIIVQENHYFREIENMRNSF